MAMTNASALVAPTYAAEKMLGTNPIAVAVPAGNEAPFVADFATTTAANGKLEIAQRKNEPIPTGWAQDANGNANPGASQVDVASSNTAVATVALATTWDATVGAYYPVITPVSEGTTTLTFTDDATGAIKATAVINVSKAVISSVVTSTDASSYDPATAVKYVVTAKDAAGNPIPDGSYTGFYAAGYEPTSNIGMQGFAVVDTLTTTSGAQSSTFYAPVTPGTTVTISAGTMQGTAGTTTPATSFQVAALNGSSQGAATFTVNGGSDASAATDAANAATDAANAAADSADAATQAAQDAGAKADAALAAVTALSQQVTSVLAKIAGLAASLARIIKKVKA